jgi:hypothetical protein
VLKDWRFWLGSVVSLALLYLVFYQTNLSEVWAALQAANYLWLLPAVALYFVGVWLRAWRWHFLLRPVTAGRQASSPRDGPPPAIPVGLLFRTIVIGYTANDVLPFRLGEIVRAYLLGSKAGISKTATLTTIVVERLMDGLTMVFFMVVASLFLPLDQVLQGTIRLSALAFIGVIAVLFLVVISRRTADALLALLLRPLPPGLRAQVTSLAGAVLDGLGALRSGGDLLGVLVFSLLGWLPETLMYALIGQGFGLGQPFSTYMLTTAAGNLGAMVPSTPGYVGVFDAPAKYALVFAGVPDGLATSYTLVLHAALLLPVILLGLYYLWREGLSLGQLRRPVPPSP